MHANRGDTPLVEAAYSRALLKVWARKITIGLQLVIKLELGHCVTLFRTTPRLANLSFTLSTRVWWGGALG